MSAMAFAEQGFFCTSGNSVIARKNEQIGETVWI
jgi:hypothetical protein